MAKPSVTDLGFPIRVACAAFQVSETLRAWARTAEIRLDYIQPGNPQQNAYVERFTPLCQASCN